MPDLDQRHLRADRAEHRDRRARHARDAGQGVRRSASSQYLLIKAPPASGKSRALMFIGLDKLYNQGLKKVIVAVPERSIGASFASTDADRVTASSPTGRSRSGTTSAPRAPRRARSRQSSGSWRADDPILVCTHATLRFAHDAIDESALDEVVLAIDEFHHVSSAENSRLGELLRSVMKNTSAHIVAMTGSYFRGDAVPVLEAADEAKFTKVTYNYYEQLNGYNHLQLARDRLPLLPGALHRCDRRGPRHRQEDDPPHPARRIRGIDQGQDPRGRRDPRLHRRRRPRAGPATGVIEVRRRRRAGDQGRRPRQRRPDAPHEDRRVPAHDVRASTTSI